MPRQRLNPFDQGSAERLLYDRYRKAVAAAEKHEREAAIEATDGRAQRALADKYADALRALGNGDKIPGQAALPDFTKLAPGREVKS